MAFRRFLRGRVEWDRLESVARAIADRYGEDDVHVEFLEADNWLSTPCVVNERWFVKIITEQNSLVHALLTTGRNIGAFTSGTEGFFDHYGTAYDMAEHEFEATKKLREIGIDAPEPIEAFEFEDLGILVLEYLPEFRTLNELDRREALSYAPDLFEALATMHDNRLAHGDLRGENVLIANNTLYFIDATNVKESGLADARSYDLACGLAALEPIIGAGPAVDSALDSYSIEEVLAAREFLDFINMRPDHDFDASAVKGEIEKQAS
ncbi:MULTISPECIES: RIO1 family regulatory kinase/ATPase [unclassified Haladaptatus]|uniref:RIO1 family regulatory kinase/ATPase domain-containing protein n=1 Tax=unclassified Haladaptatus TaxID=2622732 RepID=UPI0023E80C44|nr:MULTISPECIES: RIO1 family regulatory kinase/ATPase [unclassified Haladaptatus]